MPSAGHGRPRGRKKRRHKRAAAESRRGKAPAEGPEDLALGCQSRMEEGGLVPPHAVLAPGSALGLLRSRALPSAQVEESVARGTAAWRRNQDEETPSS